MGLLSEGTGQGGPLRLAVSRTQAIVGEGGVFNYPCFLETKISDKVQHCK